MIAVETFKALSVRQPWAWALIYGVSAPSDIENRTRRNHHRGDLVIHASKGQTDYLARTLTQWREEIPDLPDLLAAEAEHFGCLYGLLDVFDDLPLADVADQPYAEGPRCWITRNPRPIIAMPWRGFLGIFNVPADQIRMALLTKSDIPTK